MDTMAAGWCAAALVPRRDASGDLSRAAKSSSTSRSPTRTCSPPGRYPASVAIVGPEGWRWQRSVEVAVDERPRSPGRPGARRARHARRRSRPVPLRRVSRHRRGPAAGRADDRRHRASRPADAAPERRPRSVSARQSWLAGGERARHSERPKDARLTSTCCLSGTPASLTRMTGESVAAAVDRGATAVVLNPWELIVPGETSAATPVRRRRSPARAFGTGSTTRNVSPGKPAS